MRHHFATGVMIQEYRKNTASRPTCEAIEYAWEDTTLGDAMKALRYKLFMSSTNNRNCDMRCVTFVYARNVATKAGLRFEHLNAIRLRAFEPWACKNTRRWEVKKPAPLKWVPFNPINTKSRYKRALGDWIWSLHASSFRNHRITMFATATKYLCVSLLWSMTTVASEG